MDKNVNNLLFLISNHTPSYSKDACARLLWRNFGREFPKGFPRICQNTRGFVYFQFQKPVMAFCALETERISLPSASSRRDEYKWRRYQNQRGTVVGYHGTAHKMVPGLPAYLYRNHLGTVSSKSLFSANFSSCSVTQVVITFRKWPSPCSSSPTAPAAGLKFTDLIFMKK